MLHSDLTGLYVTLLFFLVSFMSNKSKVFAYQKAVQIVDFNCGLRPQETSFHKSHTNCFKVVLVSFFQL